MIICGDALAELGKLPPASVHCCVTSPPYWGLRDYGVAGQLGLERTPEEYVANLVAVFREVWRVLRDDGVMFLNLGDSYATGNAPSYGTSGKVPEDCPLRGSIWSRPCDGCQAASVLRTFHSDQFPSDGDDPNLEHMEFASGHSPTSRSSHPKRTPQSGDAIQDRKRTEARVRGRQLVSRLSKPDISSCGSRGGVSSQSHGAGCLCESGSAKDDALRNANMMAFPSSQPIGDDEQRGLSSRISYNGEIADSSADHRADTAYDSCPYLHYTTAFRNVKLKPKDLVGIPWRVAFALQADGWYLRSDIIWAKPNPMPESVKDRPTRGHEYIFLMSKNARYYYDAEAIAEPLSCPEAKDVEFYPGAKGSGVTNRHDEGRTYSAEGRSGRNRRSVWTIATRPYAEAHFATFPPDLIEPCIKAGCPVGGTVLDPFFGAGTTGLVAAHLGCEFVGIELNPAYCEMAKKRIYGELMEAAHV